MSSIKESKPFINIAFCVVMLHVATSDTQRYENPSVLASLKPISTGLKFSVPDANKFITFDIGDNSFQVRNNPPKFSVPVNYERKYENVIYPYNSANPSYYNNEPTKKEKYLSNLVEKSQDYINKDAIITRNVGATKTTTDWTTTTDQTTAGYDEDIEDRLSPSAVASLLG